MAVQIEEQAALRIAELLDLFAELPSTPGPLGEEAREHVRILMDGVEAQNPLHPEDARHT